MKNKKDFFDSFGTKLKNGLDELESLKTLLVPIHSSGYPFIIIFGILALIIGSFSDFLGWIGIILTFWCIYFFRDPNRVTPDKQGLIISPADGKILPIINEFPPDEKDKKEKMKRISIFMNIFNVHVNRIPYSGKILSMRYYPGAFFNASLDKSSKENERMVLKIRLENGLIIYVVQIAGLIARRIKCDLTEGQMVKSGEKFGIIRFGSRVDVYLPMNFSLNVLEGQTIIGGETILATQAVKLNKPKAVKTTKS